MSYHGMDMPVIRNNSGSTAGAGSGDFHQYRAQRRKEMFRLGFLERQQRKEDEEKEYQEKRKALQEQDEARTSKKSTKRKKKKTKRKRRTKKIKTREKIYTKN